MRHGAQLVARFRQRDVHRRLAVAHALEEKLQAERGLADAGIALQKIDMVARKTAEQDVIETLDAGCRNCLVLHDFRTPKSEVLRGSKSRNPANCGDRYNRLAAQCKAPKTLSCWSPIRATSYCSMAGSP